MATKTKAAAFQRLKQQLGDTDPALVAIPVAQEMHHFQFVGTWQIDLRLVCWCGSSHRVNTLGWKLMADGLNRFLSSHECCEARER